MEKSRKLLSILLAIVMVFSAVAVPVSAAVPSGVETLEDLVQPSSLAGLVDWLLTSLNNRKDQYADTVLNFVCTYVEDINAFVPKGMEDLFDSNDTEAKATILLDYVDDLLKKADLEGQIGSDVMNIIDKLPIDLDLETVDGILKTIKTLNGILIAGNIVEFFGVELGHILDLNLSALLPKGDTMARSPSEDIKIVKNLIQFLYDNRAIVKAFLDGTLTLGDLDGAVSLEELNGKITTKIKDIVYKNLLGAPDGAASHAESIYKDWKVDQMAIGAMVKMLLGFVPNDTDEINEFLDKSVYDLLTSYGDMLYEKFLLGWLQKDLIDAIKKIAQDNELSQYFNFDAEFSVTEFDFANAENGILGEFNNVVVTLLDELLAADVFAELNLENGGNDKLNANLEKVVKFVLPRMANVLDPHEYDFRKYTEEYVADKELKDLAPDVLKIFFPEWFNLTDADMAVVNQMDTLGETAALAVYYALITFNGVMFEDGTYDYIADWNAQLFAEDGVTLKDLDNSEWNTICLNMAADAAMFGLALNGDNFSFDFSIDDIKAKKEAGWQGIDFLDTIADWGISMIKGVPAVTDHLGGDINVYDGYGPFYKLNVLLNEILDWSFLSDVSYGSFNLDLETLVFDGILDNAYEFDIAGILGLFRVNEKETNVLKKDTVPALLSIVDNILNVLFSHEGDTKDVIIDATCTQSGFKANACAKCGLYVSGYEVLDMLPHDETIETIRVATCTLGGLERHTCTVCAYVYDVEKEKANHTLGDFETIEENGKFYTIQKCTSCNEIVKKVENPVIDRLEIVTPPDKLEYELNEEGGLDLTGIVVRAFYSNDSDEIVTLADLEIKKDVDTTVAGEQTVEIAIGVVTVTFSVTVVDNNEPDQPDVPEQPAYKRGDVNGDDSIDSSDARTTLRAAVGLEELDETERLAADVNEDNSIDSSDARTILRVAVGLDSLD